MAEEEKKDESAEAAQAEGPLKDPRFRVDEPGVLVIEIPMWHQPGFVAHGVLWEMHKIVDRFYAEKVQASQRIIKPSSGIRGKFNKVFGCA